MSAAVNVFPLRAEEALAEPPVPRECDLTGFKDMKLDTGRLMRSKSWGVTAKRRPELGFYMMNLWMRGWLERPAGSLPQDDDELCEAAMCDPARWPEVRAAVLKDWRPCTADGRLYHLVLCEKVLEAWGARLAFRERARKGGEAKAAREKAAREAASAATAADAPSKPGACEGKGGGEGTGGEEESGPPARLGGGGAAGEESGDSRPAPAKTPREVLLADGVAMLGQVTGRCAAGCETLLGLLLRDSGDHDEGVLRIVQAAHRAMLANRPKADPASWMRKAVRDDRAHRERAAKPQRPRGAAERETQATQQIKHFMGMEDDVPLGMDDRPFIDHEETA